LAKQKLYICDFCLFREDKENYKTGEEELISNN